MEFCDDDPSYLRWWEKAFFFEKKKQKTFMFLAGAGDESATAIKSFLVLFFKKEHFLSMYY